MGRYTITLEGMEPLQAELDRLSKIKLDGIIELNLTNMFNRAAFNSGYMKGGTPVSTEETRPGGPHGELRQSRKVDIDASVFGYTEDYAAHVEYGHRTRNGGYVKGQYFLKDNVEIQRSIFNKDVEKYLKGK